MFKKITLWLVVIGLSSAVHLSGLVLIHSEKELIIPEEPMAESHPPPKPEKKEVSLKLIPKSVGKEKSVAKECDDWYGGVGIIHFDGVITQVPGGYPASKAGVKVGDIIIETIDLRGEPGTKVVMKFMRNGEIFNKEVIRDRICREDTAP